MNSDRIEEIQKQCAYPDSQSVAAALMQVWIETAMEYKNRIAELEEINQEWQQGWEMTKGNKDD